MIQLWHPDLQEAHLKYIFEMHYLKHGKVSLTIVGQLIGLSPNIK